MKKIQINKKSKQAKKYENLKIGSVVERINELGKPTILPPMNQIRILRRRKK